MGHKYTEQPPSRALSAPHLSHDRKQRSRGGGSRSGSGSHDAGYQRSPSSSHRSPSLSLQGGAVGQFSESLQARSGGLEVPHAAEVSPKSSSRPSRKDRLETMLAVAKGRTPSNPDVGSARDVRTPAD